MEESDHVFEPVDETPSAPTEPPAADAEAGHSKPESPGTASMVAAFLMLAAGALHILLVEAHMAHARGAGLLFLGLGLAQASWAVLYFRRPDAVLRQVGIAALVVAPVGMYIITRIVRAPWSIGPEAVDAVGVVTQFAAVGAGIAMVWDHAPKFSPQVASTVFVGAMLASVGYVSTIAAEPIEWLGTPASLGVHAHGDHGPEGHGSDIVGIRGESIVGNTKYFGPSTGKALYDHCRAIGQDNQDCHIFYLEQKLLAEGSVPAFDMLEELTLQDKDLELHSHEYAHILGHGAFQAYGLDIESTLAECSYKVFQGCLHGALQAYFTDLSLQGRSVSKSAIIDVCSGATTSFEEYACLHGVGHGIMMYAFYDLHGALKLCGHFPTYFERGSCYGGVYMENVVAYLDSLKPGWEPHHGDEIPTFWVKADDPAYPCNQVRGELGHECWRMQTSLILHFNKGDFRAAAKVCDGAGEYRLDCFTSLGRDAVPYSYRVPSQMVAKCVYGDADAQEVCIKAITAGEILQDNTPEAGMKLCPQVPDKHKETCYRETGRQARNMWSQDKVTDMCARAPAEFQQVCEVG